MLRQAIKKHTFILGIILLCLCYLGFQLFYTDFAILSVDEFWFAHWVHRYANGIPYRDFSPYKTVLGYYLLLIPMSLSKTAFAPLFLTKNTLAILNTTVFFLCSLWLRKFFPKLAIVTCLALLLCSEFVLSYSTNIRVDLLAYWFCLISVMLLLEKRLILAGLILALGFLTSQKALWYMIASDAALGLSWLCFQRDKSTFRAIVFFNLTILFTVLAYIAFWSYFSSIKTVLHSMFYEAYVMYQLDWYDAARKGFWTVTTTYNPLLFLIWPLTLLSLIVTPQTDPLYRLRFFCVIFAAVIMLCLIPFKQIFPYYMVTTIPAFLLAYTAFFAWLYDLFRHPSEIKIKFIGKTGVWVFLFCYFFALLEACSFFSFPPFYGLICFIPLLLGIYVTQLPQSISAAIRFSFPSLILLTGLFIGFIYPLIIFTVFSLPDREGDYQRNMLKLSNLLLQDGSDYVAGIELFYQKNQPIPGMQHLDGPAINYLYHPSKKLLPVMMDSLYHTPATTDQVIASLQHSQVKLYVNNYRINALPISIRHYLSTQYEHFWGSIYLYAPSFTTGQHTQEMKFSGQYQIESSTPILINGKKFQPNSIIKLNQGKFHYHAAKAFRLRLIPSFIHNPLDKEFQKDDWEKMLG